MWVVTKWFKCEGVKLSYFVEQSVVMSIHHDRSLTVHNGTLVQNGECIFVEQIKLKKYTLIGFT